MGNLLITNNPCVYKKFSGKTDIVYNESFSHLDILVQVRDKIHFGHRLLTHPISGSIKPNETPYKSVLLSKRPGEVELQSLEMIESAIVSYDKFWRNKPMPNWTKQIKEDFQLIDCDLIADSVFRF